MCLPLRSQSAVHLANDPAPFSNQGGATRARPRLSPRETARRVVPIKDTLAYPWQAGDRLLGRSAITSHHFEFQNLRTTEHRLFAAARPALASPHFIIHHRDNTRPVICGAA